ncbi:MAG: hypothetical protein JWL61_4017 [Gemmatimonadetes bacterium]|jgi:hypothetical protein|nr:hypothetical protein [Gemmatimonadota bacterium]
MKRLVVLAVALATSSCSTPAEQYGFVAKLGRDTVSVEHVTRTGDRLVSDEVDRFPRVRQRHTEITLGPDGGIRHLAMDITTPSEPPAQRVRHVVADVSRDSVHITKTDSTGTKTSAFATGGTIAMAHLPQMYSLYDLYFAAALQRADSLKLAAGDSVRLRQFYIDREFDRFPLHEGFVRPLKGGRAEIRHDWLSGIGEATFDSAHHMLTYNGARTTYKVDVTRLKETPDIAAIGARFAEAEAKSGGAKQLSVRDTARASVGAATFWIDYGRPLARGRVLAGGILPYNLVWRTGANAATQFSTSAPITLAGLKVPAGKYTLWTVPRENGGAELVVNKQTGQWGTEYDDAHDLGMAKMSTETLPSPVEEFTISIVPAGANKGSLVMEWGSFRWSAPISVP